MALPSSHLTERTWTSPRRRPHAIIPPSWSIANAVMILLSPFTAAHAGESSTPVIVSHRRIVPSLVPPITFDSSEEKINCFTGG
ncbi:hypothetical protein SISSUDRAFT_1050091 [Sistotremastrum suecicum HHB10207 ss-3]|uniref:Uncharacterized protein n=1 Tax=Sistotremastrum suecicum HHB10207 ss-3 TaxID=1314776 RepID=A0A166BF77_9AGAM|nr:hypothetical protein SISSUDRAFT_1050091 [Sistotremastrum suecicum HHB10207 ss-3]